MTLSRTIKASIATASLALGVLLVVVAFPHVANAGWENLTDQLAVVKPWRMLEIVVTWAAGLYVYTFVLTASMPDLKRHRALALNLGGSGISNVMPLGGAAGIGLNYAMLRSWGYNREHVARFTAVSQTITAVSKILVGLAGLVAFVTVPSLRGVVPFPEETTMAMIGLITVLVGLVVYRVGRRVTLPAYRRLRTRVGELARQTMALARSRWLPLTLGSIGYAALQLFLFELCLGAVHAGLSVGLIAAGYAVDRLLVLVPITPGGVGIVEAGVTGVLVALGGDPTLVATGVLLFRAFSYFAEIPIGGVVMFGWFAQQSFRARAHAST